MDQTTIVVGLMTYVVSNPKAADLLLQAKAAHKAGDAEKYLQLKMEAARVEDYPAQ